MNETLTNYAIAVLDAMPVHFTIGRDAFGFWYSLNGGAARVTGFESLNAAIEHYVNNRKAQPK